MILTDRRQISLAFRDVVQGTLNWRPWYLLGLSEMRQRYRRSTLGPFWVTITMGIQALIMGFLFSFLFNMEIGRFLPYLCIGIVTWTFLANSINEGATCFITQSSAILQVKRPLWMYIMLVLWRNAILYAHTIGIFILAALAYRIYPSETWLLIPLGLGLLALNAGWMALVAGILSARFRDVPLIITNAFNVLLWLTPVYYRPEQLGAGKTRMVIELNPLTPIIEVARAPFLNEVPHATTWLIAAGITVLGWTLAFALLVRARARVPYWV